MEKAEILKIFKERTRKLAELQVEDQATGRLLPVLVFQLGAERYGIESTRVVEILRERTFTPLPGLPPFIEGIFSLRGQLHTLVNLAKFFGLEPDAAGSPKNIIIVDAGGVMCGISTDAYHGIRLVREEEMESEPMLNTEQLTGFIQCFTKDQLPVLDIKKILQHPDMTIADSIE